MAAHDSADTRTPLFDYVPNAKERRKTMRPIDEKRGRLTSGQFELRSSQIEPQSAGTW